MSDQEQTVTVPTNLQSPDKRPLGALSEPAFITFLAKLLETVTEHDKDHLIFTPQMKTGFKDVIDRVMWMSDRLVTYEGGLIPLVQGLNTLELDSVLSSRREPLYFLFHEENKDLTNAELIERILGKWKRPDTITVEVNPKEPFDPIKLMSAFTSELRNYSIDIKQKDAEPEMILQTGRNNEVQRFINFDWIEWFLKKHGGKATPQDAIDLAVEQVKVRLFGSVDNMPKGTTVSVDTEKCDPEIIFEQLVKRRI